MIFNPANKTVSGIVQPMDRGNIGSMFDQPGVFEYGLFEGIAAAGNGKLYCPPSNCGVVAVCDPVSQSIEFIAGAGLGSQHNTWAGVVMSPNGFLFCAPARARCVLVIDPGLTWQACQWVGTTCGSRLTRGTLTQDALTVNQRAFGLVGAIVPSSPATLPP